MRKLKHHDRSYDILKKVRSGKSGKIKILRSKSEIRSDVKKGMKAQTLLLQKSKTDNGSATSRRVKMPRGILRNRTLRSSPKDRSRQNAPFLKNEPPSQNDDGERKSSKNSNVPKPRMLMYLPMHESTDVLHNDGSRTTHMHPVPPSCLSLFSQQKCEKCHLPKKK